MLSVTGSADRLNRHTLWAQPDRSGFLGLSQLHAFTSTVVEPQARSKSDATLILDFSLVRIWDIAALLWLVLALHHYRHVVGLDFRIRLPEGQDGMSAQDRVAFDKSADFLRRWVFDQALSNIASDVDTLLLPEQAGYFPIDGPKHYYRQTKVTDDRGLEQSLVSRRLVEIRNLAQPMVQGNRAITAGSIAECIRRFQSERIGDILCAQCGIEKRKADLFADHLLTEALLNVHEHPRATIGMLGISVMGGSNELVLSVVDNGDSIGETIYARYRDDHLGAEPGGTPLPEEYDRTTLEELQRSEIIDYAFCPGVTSKKGYLEGFAGMGLTYIRDDTLGAFHGRLRVITDSLCLRYSGDIETAPEVAHWRHPWHGNLLRVAIPLSSDRGTAVA